MTIKTIAVRAIVAAHCLSHTACYHEAAAPELSSPRGSGDNSQVQPEGHEVDPLPGQHTEPGHEQDPSEGPDAYVLQQSLEMIDTLEIRRGQNTLLQLSYSQLQEQGPPTTMVLYSQAFVAHWQRTFARWLADVSESETEDARAIVAGLASYFVGVDEISIGPSCGPVGSGYVYGSVKAGVPGDGVAKTLAAEIVRSEQDSRTNEAKYETYCITDFQSRGVVGTNVIIRLPDDPGTPLSDNDVWQEQKGARLRVGVPVPKPWTETPWYEGIDPLLLEQSLDHLAQVEIRRGERELASKPASTIEQFRPTHALTLTREAYLTRWRDTFVAWIYQSSNSAFADAEAIVRSLSSYAIGAGQVSVGPECEPLGASYSAGIIEAGQAGDGALDVVAAAIARSDAALAQPESSLATHCSTVVSAEPGFVATPVVLRLTAGSSELGDIDVWDAEQGPGARAGVPLP